MRKLYKLSFIQRYGFVILLAMIFFPRISKAQQLYIDSFAVFGGNGNCPAGLGQTPCLSPGCAVLIGPASKIVGGSVGSYRLVKTTGSATITGNIFSGGTIQLSNSNSVTGRITAANSPVTGGTILQVGSSATLKGNIDVNGKIVIGGGTVSGKVTHPVGTTYSGPVPAGGNVTGTPALPIMPVMPAITEFPAAGTTDITSTKTIIPGSYGKISLSGNKTITLSGTGIYVFSAIKNSGSANTFKFDFKNDPAGSFLIYIYGDVNLGKSAATMVNGGSASRIYAETHGKGKTYSDKTCSWYIANGSAGGTSSKWLGTVWAPYAAIYVGSGSGNCEITGALWSGTQVNINANVTINYAPFQQFPQCSTPNVTAGPDKQLDCSTATAQLSGNSSTPNVQYSWTAIDGGNISSGANTATPTVSAAGTYILTVTAGGCTAKDTALVTFNPCILPFYPPPPNGKVNDIIGAELNSLAANFGHVADSAKTIFIIRHDSVYIEVISLVGQTQTLLNLLQTPAYGLTDIISNGPNSLVITGKFPIAHLTKLDSLPASSYIDFVRPLFPPLGNSGIINTQGDSAIQSGFVRGGFNLSGNGIKIGVLSDSYNTILGNPAHTDIVNGDLPGAGNPDNPTPVNVLQEYPFGRASDEGRAMLQIIHDIAPKATLDFRTGFISAGDFAQGVLQLQQDGCNIIVDDVTYINDPFFDDGPISLAINQVTSQGVAYFSAAGNYGMASYSGIFNPTTAPNGITGFAHNFGGTFLQNDSLYPGTYTMVLQWQDSIYSIGQTNTGTTADLDIYLTDSQGKALFGFNRNNIGGDPMEVIPFTVTAPTATNIMIIQANGNKPVPFKYVVFRGNLKINTFNTGNSTIVGHANADSSITVGAVRFTNTPAFGVGTPVVETFSSLGGTTVRGTVRNKPDFTAPDGVSTTIDFGSINISGTPFPSFFGTSASAPHAAAAAALLMEGKKKYYNQALTPSQVRSLLKSTALPMGAPGNFLSGYGFIRADSAMKTLASPTPLITKLALQDSSIAPGTQDINIIVYGNYFSPNTVVKFRSTTLPTTIVNSTTAIAQVPTFTGNPPIQAFTPPKSTSGADGGFSLDTLYLFSPVKKIVIVTADNKSKKYGEKLPAFTATVLVDSVPLGNTTFTLHELGLDSIIYTTPASNLSNAGIYFIRPSIRPLNPADSADAALLETYKYIFNDGQLHIAKMPLLITPRDTTLHYGDKIGAFHFNYSYADLNVAPGDKAALFDSILTTHQSNLVDTAIAVVNSKAIFSGQILTDADLNHLSFLATGNAISSSKAIFSKSIKNGVEVTDTTRVVDVPAQAIFNFETDPESANLVNSKAIFSGIALLSGEATLNSKAIFSKSTTILNSANTNDSSNSKLAVIVDSTDLGSGSTAEISVLKAINLITGLTAGINTIVPGAMLSNNFEISYGLGHLAILPAVLTVKTKDTSFVYGITPAYRDTISGFKYDDVLSTVTTGPPAHTLFDSKNHIVTGSKIPAGTYKIVPSALPLVTPPNYTVNYVNGTLTVTKAVLHATCADTSREYGSSNPVFRIIYQGFVNGDDASSLSPTPVAKTTATTKSYAGTYPISLSVSSSTSYTIVSTNGTLTITPAPLTVKADDKFINDNASLPKLTSTITGFKNGDKVSSCFISGSVYTVSPAYTKGHPGVYTITPSGLILHIPGNYTITYLTGTLYVSKYGCQVTTKLNCVQKLTNDPSGYSYVARFSYTNTNATTVYVPLGSNNGITTSLSGKFSGQPPIAFAPGTGTFDIYFNGVKITWTLVTSATSSASASSSSAKCTNSFAAQSMTAAPASAMTESISANTLADSSDIYKHAEAYPNPTTGWVNFSISNAVISEKDIQVIGVLGRRFPAKMNGNASIGKFSLDLSGLVPGVYFVRVRVENNFKVFRIVKL